MDSSSSGFPILPRGAISFHFSIRGTSVGEFSVSSVPIYPGLILLTRTPRFAHSTARDLVSWTTAALEALYAHCGCGTFTMCADMEAVLMMEPPPLASIYFPAAISVKKMPFRLTLITFSHWS